MRNSTFQGVFLTSAEGLAAYNRKHFKRGTISMAKERLFLLPLSIFFTRNSCLEPAFNNEIYKYTSSGLIFIWSKIYIDPKYVRERRINKILDDPEKLSVDQITGIIIIWCVMYGISFSVFCLEIVSVKYDSLQFIFDIL